MSNYIIIYIYFRANQYSNIHILLNFKYNKFNIINLKLLYINFNFYRNFIVSNFYFIARGDKGIKYGFGHIIRIIRVYKKIENFFGKNFSYIFLVNKEKNVLKKIKSLTKKKTIIKDINLFEKNKFKKGDFIPFDTLGVKKNYLKIINKKKINLISFDHTDLKNIKKGLLINGIFFSKKNLFTKNKKIKILQGPQFNMIYNNRDLKNNVSKSKKCKILISSGGSDKKGMILKLLKQLKNEKKFDFLIPIGPGFDKKQIENYQKIKQVKLFFNQKNLLNLMKKSDFNIVSGGLTMFESIASINPTLVIKTYENQKFAIRYFLSKHLIFYLNTVEKINFSLIYKCLINFNKIKENQLKKKTKIRKIFSLSNSKKTLNYIVQYINQNK